jgi:hypothetical protein
MYWDSSETIACRSTAMQSEGECLIELLERYAEANNNDKYRFGNIIRLPAQGSLIVTGDLHGHRRNFERAISYADLDHHADRHLIFHEIIHGGPEDSLGGCLSFRLLYDVFRFKVNFPDRVHVIIGNHDTAFMNNSEVMKDGREMNHAMCQAIGREFNDAAGAVESAMRQSLFSQPLAVRCDNRIWISHSLPADRSIGKFDPGIFNRTLENNDIVRPGSAYLLTWGRKHSQALLDSLATTFDIDTFVLGHQHQGEGWYQAGKNLIILDSNHNHGCLLSIDLAQSYTIEQLIEATVPLASVS